MKKIFIFAAAAVLFSACANSKQSGEVKSLEPVDGTIPVAVINADTIFSQYQLAIELREQLTKKQQTAERPLRRLPGSAYDAGRPIYGGAYAPRRQSFRPLCREKRRLLPPHSCSAEPQCGVRAPLDLPCLRQRRTESHLS